MAEPRSPNKTPVVFFDRDGTINHEIGPVYELSQMELIDGAAAAVKKLKERGIVCIVLTNQSGPARGYFPESHVVELNKHLKHLLADQGAHIDAVYYCPHHEQGVVPEYAICCDCRKPKPGMVDQARADFPNVDLAFGYMIGDQSTDIELAKNARLRSVLVRTGHGQAVVSGTFQWKVDPDHVADSVMAAADWVLSDLDARMRHSQNESSNGAK